MLREFRIGDVFEKIQIKPIGKKAGDFPGSYSPSFPVPLLTSGTGNQGLSRYAGRQDCPDILHGCISIASNGAAGAAYYQPGPFAVLQDAYAVTVKSRGIKSEPEGLYLAAAIRKVTGGGTYGWTNKAGWEKVKLEKMTLEFKVKTGKNDQVFGTISTKQIADELKKKEIDVDKRKIRLDVPVNTLGVTEVSVLLHKEVEAKLKIRLVK